MYPVRTTSDRASPQKITDVNNASPQPSGKTMKRAATNTRPRIADFGSTFPEKTVGIFPMSSAPRVGRRLPTTIIATTIATKTKPSRRPLLGNHVRSCWRGVSIDWNMPMARPVPIVQPKETKRPTRAAPRAGTSS